MNKNYQELIEAIRKKNIILFVGAGVSASLGLPTFRDLINHIAERMGYEQEIYNVLGGGDYLTLAEYYKIKKGSIGELRSWMDTNWHNPNIKINESKIHELIIKLDFPIIYTTNYDRWIEKAYDYHKKGYTKIKNVADIKDTKNGKTQIIKFHGDFDDDNSIVLTETSYFDRLNFDGPLDIKLRSDTLGKGILFIGYSLDDINIRYLLYKLTKLWESSSRPELKPKSFVFLPRPNEIKKTILENKGVNVINSEIDNLSKATEEFLETLWLEIKNS
ncbi:SIR2 family NAD-dependent protein deacylase [Pseudalkalibacillus berkeleyi]|uniref:SIR2 family protein n=1 Tax=Pseudalkalibacillus berkeleyi TaxID=1069813 RepID=A0ABS9GUF6_9BACL|nr:SIR2 family protein [Pseudalkalibacillus berkeleyi]MCF6136467.1 SIR2 family protein [Pseudalkalibacillus berkeleyi]